MLGLHISRLLNYFSTIRRHAYLSYPVQCFIIFEIVQGRSRLRAPAIC